MKTRRKGSLEAILDRGYWPPQMKVWRKANTHCGIRHSSSSFFMVSILVSFPVCWVTGNFKISVYGTFAAICTFSKQQKLRVTQHAYSKLKCDNKVTLCLVTSALMLWTSVLHAAYVVPCLFHFCAFCWWSCCLKCTPPQYIEVLPGELKKAEMRVLIFYK
jgi:hypothetical protein